MADFEEFVRKEREQPHQRRDEPRRQRGDPDRKIEEIGTKFVAVAACERVKIGKDAAPSATGSRRRTGVRQKLF